ncbi:hypothetical protein, partial [Treponema socranskii]|uniref:hypothetical protein n=1 Tax=Treponema socranskii TaxID=53419 RepID=UPI0028E91C9E
LQKYAAVLQRYDTASLPCIEGRSPRNLQRARSTKSPAQNFFASPIKEKRVKRFSIPDFTRAISSSGRSRLSKNCKPAGLF